MKKTLLIAMVAAPSLLWAQVPSSSMIIDKNANVVAEITETIDVQVPEVHTKGKQTIDKNKVKNYASVQLGTTFYDLQTNSSPGRRIVLHTDGTISAVWTSSPTDADGFPDRGAGYNYYNGTQWLSDRDDRIESNTRTGWPSLSVLEDGSEMIVAHESNTGGFAVSTNGAKGSTNFTTVDGILDDETILNTNRVPIWNRSVATNGKLHLICNYWSSEDNNVDVVTIDGVPSPTTYSRWDIAGDTADVFHSLLPGYDSSLYTSGGGDRYAIDAQGNTVAILMGGLGEPVSLWKSTDNGQNWTYTDVDNFAYKGVKGPAALLISGDTVMSNDGSLDVMIDAAGVVHAFWGVSSVLGNTNADGDTVIGFFPGQMRTLAHWKEGDIEPQMLGGGIDMDGDGELLYAEETWQNLTAEGSVPTGLNSATRTGATSIITMPSASIDQDGNIFVTYSAPVEGVTHFLDANFRDIHVMYSTNGGTDWSEPQNLTQSRDAECNFPNAAKMSNEFLHLIWQQDETPGTFLQNHSAAFGTHPNEINEINYAAIPVSDILNDVIGQNLVSVNEQTKDAEVFVVSQNQPNPFNGSSDVIIYLRDASPLTLTVTDILGNVINQGDLGMMNAGNHTVNIDGSELSSGIYFYTISSEFNSITKKMQVK